MTADIVNLRQARKRRARADKDALATASRAKHGLSKAQRSKARGEQARADGVLDGHKRSPASVERDGQGPSDDEQAS